MKFANIISIFLLAASALNGFTAVIKPPVEPPKQEKNNLTHQIWRLNPDKDFHELFITTKYPKNYELKVSVLGCPDYISYDIEAGYKSSNTGEYSKCADGEAGDSVKYVFTINKEKLPERSGDWILAENMGISAVGSGTLSMSDGKPDFLMQVDIQWDAATDICTTKASEDKTSLEKKIIPEAKLTKYILYSEKKNKKQTLIGADTDVYAFLSESDNDKVFLFLSGAEIKLSVVQSEVTLLEKTYQPNDEYQIVEQIPNLEKGIKTYLKFELTGNKANDAHYSFCVLNCLTLDETRDWDKGEDLKIEKDKDYYCIFKNVNSEMFLQMSEYSHEFQSNFDFDKFIFYDDNLHRFSCSFEKVMSEVMADIHGNIHHENQMIHYFDRIKIKDLKEGQRTIVKIVLNSNPQNSETICFNLSRLKPVIMVHGIDGIPRFHERDATMFGDLANNDNNQYYDFRPYNGKDFPWLSENNSLFKYIGANENGLLGFIEKHRKTCAGNGSKPMKATLIGHSCGCLLTYYQCNKQNNQFKESVSDIILAAPPMFGSDLSSTAVNLWPLSSVIKRTSLKNLKLLSRGSENVWFRYKNPLRFDSSRLIVVGGLEKHADWKDVQSAIEDSMKKEKRKNWTLENYLDPLRKHDCYYDFVVDALEGCVELFFATELGQDIVSETSEVSDNNRADSAVATYSANIGGVWLDFKNSEIHFIEDRMHSEVQHFEPDNKIFVEAVRNRIRTLE